MRNEQIYLFIMLQVFFSIYSNCHNMEEKFMSKMQKISLMNDFIFNLSYETQRKIENYVGNDYSIDDAVVLENFGLVEAFEEYVRNHAA